MLHLARVKVAVLQIQPDAVILELRGITYIEGQHMPQRAEAREFMFAPFRQNFTFPHGFNSPQSRNHTSDTQQFTKKLTTEYTEGKEDSE